MRIYYPNLIDAYSAIADTSHASTDLTGANVAQEHPSKVWRTGTSTATESVTIDLGSAQAATAAIIFAHTLLNTDSTIQLRGSSDNFGASNTLVATFTWIAGPMVITFGSASFRYWRVIFTKAAAGVSRDIGRVFVGNFVTLAGLPDFDGFESVATDMSQSERSEGGQIYSARRPQYRVFKLSLSGMSQSQGAALKLFSDTVGTRTAFFMVADENAPADESGETVYVKLDKALNRKAGGLDASGNLAWESTLAANEEL
jgi:hypothetical protein